MRRKPKTKNNYLRCYQCRRPLVGVPHIEMPEAPECNGIRYMKGDRLLRDFEGRVITVFSSPVLPRDGLCRRCGKGQ